MATRIDSNLPSWMRPIYTKSRNNIIPAKQFESASVHLRSVQRHPLKCRAISHVFTHEQIPQCKSAGSNDTGEPALNDWKSGNHSYIHFHSVLALNFVNSSRIWLNSANRFASPSRSDRRCSSLSSSKSSSSFWCQGYRTKTWKARAEEAITKFVSEKPRVSRGIVSYVRCLCRYVCV